MSTREYTCTFIWSIRVRCQKKSGQKNVWASLQTENSHSVASLQTESESSSELKFVGCGKILAGLCDALECVPDTRWRDPALKTTVLGLAGDEIGPGGAGVGNYFTHICGKDGSSTKKKDVHAALGNTGALFEDACWEAGAGGGTREDVSM
jgi:hypothetical protein